MTEPEARTRADPNATTERERPDRTPGATAGVHQTGPETGGSTRDGGLPCGDQPATTLFVLSAYSRSGAGTENEPETAGPGTGAVENDPRRECELELKLPGVAGSGSANTS